MLIEQDPQQRQQVAKIIPAERHAVDGDLHKVGEQSYTGKRGKDQPHIEVEARQRAEAPAQHHAAPGEIVVLWAKA